jgi:hypothetical protein
MKKIYRFLPLVFLIQLLAAKAIAQVPRQYYTNRAIAGTTEDTQGVNYLLLHKIYTGTLMDDHYVMGKITAIRGSVTGWNRKWTVEVNTASAYNTNRGSIICYNEPASLVTLTYNAESYLAVSINNASKLFYFSFTGYALNESLTLVYDNDVSNVQPFSTLDPLTIQGNVGIGNVSPSAKLHVTGPQGISLAKFTQPGIADADGFFNIENATTITGQFIPGIRARSSASGRPWALSLVGEAEDITPPANEIVGGAIILDGRSKNGSPLVNNNVLMVNSYGNNLVAVKANGSVGIGTTTTGDYKLAVEGTIGARKVKVTQTSWADFVFDSGYSVPALKDVEAYIHVNHHLPDMTGAAEVKDQGLDVGEMNKKLLQKIEELTLYLIEQQKMISALQAKDAVQEAKIQALENK